MPRIAVVHKEKCNPVGCGGYLCIRMCPVNRQGKECIVIDTDKKIRINEELCTSACSICQNVCPFGAIDIINLPEELKEEAIHRYGENGFCLYKLPIPIFGKVVGILGRNATGKTTAVKILSGLLRANLGKNEAAGYEQLIRRFRGSEAQVFFEKLKDGQIKASYKPQQVDTIPRFYKGKVRDILRKLDEKNELGLMAEELDISDVMNRNISELSGGELQRVAIAASVLKKADLYIFDEPSSYLDIRQRLKVAKFIRELANESTAVAVVEHDLIILDYMTDLIHIMYGKEACYGISSLPLTTRHSINVYLDGFLKEENIRIRDKPLKFLGKAQVKLKKENALISWEGLEKSLNGFRLTAKEGVIHKKMVIGVVGENGIGKTTFVRILAGVLEKDNGIVKGRVKVSYKPQYLESESNATVENVLAAAVQKYKTQLIAPLQIEPLLTRKVSELSGGELQRVAIAQCLSQEADIYLLDEPSAYLDVEQRAVVAKIIKDITELRECSVLVVDHDLLFVDYLSDELIVFNGMPASQGEAFGPMPMNEGMNAFLKNVGITIRRDKDSQRPRINKHNSRTDREQKEEGRYYY